MYTTLNKIEACEPCDRGKAAIYNFVGKTYPDDEPIPFHKLIDAVGLFGAIWCLRTIDGHVDEKLLFYDYCIEGHTHGEMIEKFLELFGE